MPIAAISDLRVSRLPIAAICHLRVSRLTIDAICGLVEWGDLCYLPIEIHEYVRHAF